MPCCHQLIPLALCVQVKSARQCALFRRGLAQLLEHVNHRLMPFNVAVKRFQVLREELSCGNGLVDRLGELQRSVILRRYRHIVDDMYQHEGKYPHKWMAEPEDGVEAGRGAGLEDGLSTPRLGGGIGMSPRRVRDGAEGDVEAQRQAAIVEYLSNMAALRVGAGGYEGRVYTAYDHGDSEDAGRGDLSHRARALRSGETSPRYGSGAWTHRSNGSQQRLPQSVRILSADLPLSGNTTPRDRGR